MTGCLSYLLLTALFLQDGTAFDVGQHGTQLLLPDGWTRKQWISGMGNDQFVGNGTRTMIIEISKIFVGEPTAKALFDNAIEGLESAVKVSKETRRRKEVTDDGVIYRAILAYTESQVDVDHAIAVVLSGSLLYILQSQALRNPQRAANGLELLLAGIRRPGPDSEWEKGRQPQLQTVRMDTCDVHFQIAPILWRSLDGNDAKFAMTSIDTEARLMIFDYSGDLSSNVSNLEAYFESKALDIANNTREEFKLQGLPAYRGCAETDDNTGAVFTLLVQVTEESCVELRLLVDPGLEVARPLWEEIEKTVAIHVHPDVKAFPTAQTAAAIVETPPPRIQAWLTRAKHLGTSAVRAGSAIATKSDFVVYGSGGVQRMSASGEATWEYQADDTLDDGRVLFTPEGEVAMLFGSRLWTYPQQEEWTPVTHDPALICQWGKKTLLVIRSNWGQMEGYGALHRTEPERCVELTPDGELVPLFSDRQREVRRLVSDAEGINLFIARQRLGFDSTPADIAFECTTRDGDGKEHPAGLWRLGHVVPAPKGWLITGKMQGSDLGIYYLQSTGTIEQLTSGDAFRAVKMDGGNLIVSGPVYAPATGETSGTALYAVPLAVVREEGLKTSPFGATYLHHLATHALQTLELERRSVFNTRESLYEFLQCAEQKSVQSRRGKFPVSTEEVDGAFQLWIRENRSLSESAITLIAAILARSYLEQGARWIDGDGDPTPYLDVIWESCWARCDSPMSIARSTLYLENSYWRPVGEVIDKLSGRTLLLGVDSLAMRSALNELPEDELWTVVESGSTDQILELLKKNESNRYLRHEVYTHLASRGRHATLVEVCRSFIAFGDSSADDPELPEFLDCRAFCGATLQLLSNPDLANTTTPSLDECFKLLQRMIPQYPRSPVLYNLLGASYHRRNQELDLARARKCFEKTLSLVEEGVYAQAAREGLEEVARAEDTQGAADAGIGEKDD